MENINKSLNYQLELQREQKSRTVKLKYGYLFDKEKEILYYGDAPIKLTTKEIKIILAIK
jgi:two-component system, response regulator PdtaR